MNHLKVTILVFSMVFFASSSVVLPGKTDDLKKKVSVLDDAIKQKNNQIDQDKLAAVKLDTEIKDINDKIKKAKENNEKSEPGKNLDELNIAAEEKRISDKKEELEKRNKNITKLEAEIKELQVKQQKAANDLEVWLKTGFIAAAAAAIGASMTEGGKAVGDFVCAHPTAVAASAIVLGAGLYVLYDALFCDDDDDDFDFNV